MNSLNEHKLYNSPGAAISRAAWSLSEENLKVALLVMDVIFK